MADTPLIEKTFNEDLNINSRVKEGAILARIFIEIQANDKGAAEKALQTTVFDSLANENDVKLLHVKMFEFRKDKEAEMFSGIAEIKLLVRDFRWFISVVMRYGPSAIEIIEPNSVTLSMDEMHDLLIDVSGMSQTLSSQLFAMLKDDERKALYTRMLSKGNEKINSA